MARMFAKVTALIEMDVEKIINEIMHERKCDVDEITMDDICYYVNDNISYLKGTGPGVYEVGAGHTIEGFEEKTYEKIEEILNEMKGEN